MNSRGIYLSGGARGDLLPCAPSLHELDDQPLDRARLPGLHPRHPRQRPLQGQGRRLGPGAGARGRLSLSLALALT